MTGCRHPGKLYVYECRGPSYPLDFPRGPHLLGIWPDPPFHYIFCRGEPQALVHEWLRGRPEWTLHGTYELDYAQWQQVSMEDQHVGRFVVRPATEGSPESLDAKDWTLYIDPGIVFGSGMHPTTRACLLLLDEFMEGLQIRSVLDFGTGTGILAVAASRLGVDRVFAVDCSPLAIDVARRNLERNCPRQDVNFVVSCDLRCLGRGVDLVVANIEWPSLKAFMAAEEDFRRQRFAILSGFLHGQREEFFRIFPHDSWEVLHERVLDGWVALLAANRERGEGRL